MRASWSIGLAGLLLVGGCAEENFNTQGGAFVPMGAAIESPHGYQDMCAGPRASLCRTGTVQMAHQDIAPPAPVRPTLAKRLAAMQAAGTPAWRTVAGSKAATQDFKLYDGLLDLSAASGRFQATAFASSGLAQGDATGAVSNARPAAELSFADNGLPRAEPLENVAEAQSGSEMSQPTPAAAPDDAPMSVQTSSPEIIVRGKRPLSERLAQLDRINRYVNSHTRQETDLQHYGTVEFWTRSGAGPGAVGDCEDLAIEKRWELIERGYPREDLFYAEVYREDLGLHIVLVAHTEGGDYVLDSRSMDLTPWNRTAYYWIKRQAPGDETTWVAIDATRSSRSVTLAQATTEATGAVAPDGGATQQH